MISIASEIIFFSFLCSHKRVIAFRIEIVRRSGERRSHRNLLEVDMIDISDILVHYGSIIEMRETFKAQNLSMPSKKIQRFNTLVSAVPSS